MSEEIAELLRDAKAEMDRVSAMAFAACEFVESQEWAMVEHEGHCPSCGHRRDIGHRENCQMAKLKKALEVES